MSSLHDRVYRPARRNGGGDMIKRLGHYNAPANSFGLQIRQDTFAHSREVNKFNASPGDSTRSVAHKQRRLRQGLWSLSGRRPIRVSCTTRIAASWSLCRNNVWSSDNIVFASDAALAHGLSHIEPVSHHGHPQLMLYERVTDGVRDWPNSAGECLPVEEE